MNISTTLTATLVVLAILFSVHVLVVYKVHKATTFEHEFLDHRHQEGQFAELASSFVPIIVKEEHLTSELYLPDALRYPIYRNQSAESKTNPNGRCCEMRSIRGRSPRNIQCEGICNTERACVDEFYPFKSKEQMTFFMRDDLNETDFLKLRLRCKRMNRRLAPPYSWCHQWKVAAQKGALPVSNKNIVDLDRSKLEQHNYKHINPEEAKLPPPGCSQVSEGGGSGAYQHLTLFPEAKLAFCGIPKISITQWLQFLRFTFGAKDFQAFPHAKPDVKLMRFDKLREDSQRIILNDPEWKFAVFLRNPAERLLSAYLDKVNGTKRDKDHFLKLYNKTESPTFEEFVRIISQNRVDFELASKTQEKLQGVDWFTDPHWRPQSYSCGLSEFLPRFQYVGSLDGIEDQARELLQKVGLWDNYGQYYHKFTDTSGMKQGICSLEPPSLGVGEELFGFLQLPREKNGTAESYRHSHHSTGSQSKLDEYYTPELKSLVEKKLYPMDVKLWKLVEDNEKLVSGSELAMKISGQCKRKAHQLIARTAEELD